MKYRLSRMAALVLAIALFATYTTPVFASTLEYRNNNDVTTVNPKAVACSASSGGSISVNINDDLPEETLSKIKAAGIEEKVKSNMERYAAAQAATGLPWQIFAAIHYREANLAANASLADGSSLSNSKSIDGAQKSADANEDAILAAKHFISLLKSIYDTDLSAGLSIDGIANGFLAYNRGAMYKNWNKTWQESPYVSNGVDANHLNMKWIDADSYAKPGGKKYNSLSGKTETRPGALAVYKFLGGPLEGQAGTPSPLATGNGQCADNGSAATGALVNADGYTFPLLVKKSELATPAQGLSPLPCKNTTSPTACHHSPWAFDISNKAVAGNRSLWRQSNGVKAVAISDGTITSLKGGYNGRQECLSIQLQSVDGYKYWYGHTVNAKVKQGDTVKAGQEISEVGPTICAKSTVPHLHIDRGSPKGANGGSPSRRDPGIVPLINKLYEQMP